MADASGNTSPRVASSTALDDNVDFHCCAIFAQAFCSTDAASPSSAQEQPGTALGGAIKHTFEDFVVVEIGLSGRKCTELQQPSFDAQILALDPKDRPRPPPNAEGKAGAPTAAETEAAKTLKNMLRLPAAELLPKYLSRSQISMLDHAAAECLTLTKKKTDEIVDGDAAAQSRWELNFNVKDNPIMFGPEFTRRCRVDVYSAIARAYPILLVKQMRSQSAALTDFKEVSADPEQKRRAQLESASGLASLTKSTYVDAAPSRLSANDTCSSTNLVSSQNVMGHAQEWSISLVHDERFDVFLPLLKTPETVLQLLRFAKVPDDHRDVLYRHEGRSKYGSMNRQRKRKQRDACPTASLQLVLHPKACDRPGRTRVHQLIKTHFKFFQTETTEDGSSVTVNYRTRFKKKKRTRIAPPVVRRDESGSVISDDAASKSMSTDVPELMRHRYWQFLLRKRNVEHNAAMKAIAAAAGGGIQANSVCTAGMKDRVADTAQHATLTLRVDKFNPHAYNIFALKRILEKFSSTIDSESSATASRGHGVGPGAQLVVEHAVPCAHPLDIGALRGNFFQITIRGVRSRDICVPDKNGASSGGTDPPLCIDDLLKQRSQQLQTNGFVNYFGPQRVGRPGRDNGVSSWMIAAAALQNRWEQCFRYILLRRGGYVLQREGKSDLQTSIAAGEKNNTQQALVGDTFCIGIPSRDKHGTTGRGGREGPTEAEKIIQLCVPSKAVQRIPKWRQEERRLVEGLARCNGAINATTGPLIYAKVPQNIRRTWVHALQSALWNLMATDRMQLQHQQKLPSHADFTDGQPSGSQLENLSVIVGDLVQDAQGKVHEVTPELLSQQPRARESEEISRSKDHGQWPSIWDVVLPLPGSATLFSTVPGHSASAAKLRKLLIAQGVGDFAVEELSTSNYAGGYRHLLTRPGDCAVSVEPTNSNDASRGGVDATLQFSLPKSSYATMALREFLRIPSLSGEEVQR